jgi:integrase
VILVTEQLVFLEDHFVRKPPKTKAGRRRVTIPTLLAEMVEEQISERSNAGADGLVFPNKRGNPIHPSSFNGAHWTPAKRRVGLEGVRFHDLRHTAVALAIAQGAHPKAIQARMGHSSVQVTLDRYGHLFPELDANIADGLDQTFRASLTLLRGGAEDASQDTRRTQMTRGGHKSRSTKVQSGQPRNSENHP